MSGRGKCEPMMRSQEVQYKAVLARFGGNHKQAWLYCVSLCIAYPHLVAEYGSYAWEEE